MDLAAILGGALESEKVHERHQTPSMPYVQTHIFVAVANCIVDYQCKNTQCRLLHSMGYIGISTSMTSHSTQIGLKVTVKDLNAYLSGNSLAFSVVTIADLHFLFRYRTRSFLHPTPTILDKLVDRTNEKSVVDHAGKSTRKTSSPSFPAFLEKHRFLLMYYVDSARISILQGLESGGTNIEIAIGLLSLLGCIDSYHALAVGAFFSLVLPHNI